MELETVRAVVESIPRGRWASYGDVCAAAGGGETHARTLNGRLTRAEAEGAHRVLKSDGTVALTALGDPDAVRAKLESEGVRFDLLKADPEQRFKPEAIITASDDDRQAAHAA